MATRTSRLFLDTQICIDVAKKNIPPSEWQRLWRYIRQRFEYCISPLTYIELLRGLARANRDFFGQNLEPLRVLVAAGQRSFLEMPGRFAIGHVLGSDPSKPGVSPKDFEQWSRVILKAKDQQSLSMGTVRFSHISRKEFGFSFQTVAKQHEAGIKAHQQELQALRQGELVIPPSRDRWAAVILKSLRQRSSSDDCRRFGCAVDAAFQYDLHLWNLVLSSNYNLEKHRTDWVDQQQLYYLADERMYFLTADSEIKHRVRKSIQRDRIFVYGEFKESA